MHLEDDMKYNQSFCLLFHLLHHFLTLSLHSKSRWWSFYKICFSTHLSVCHIPNTKQSSVSWVHFSALVLTECLLKVGEQATLQERAENIRICLAWTRGRDWDAFSSCGVQLCRHCMLLCFMASLCWKGWLKKKGKCMLLSSDDIWINLQYFYYFERTFLRVNCVL